VLDAWNDTTEPSVVAVFSTREKADRALQRLMKRPGGWYAGVVKRTVRSATCILYWNAAFQRGFAWSDAATGPDASATFRPDGSSPLAHDHPGRAPIVTWQTGVRAARRFRLGIGRDLRRLRPQGHRRQRGHCQRAKGGDTCNEH
jgi:hypothetical protein